MSVYVDVPFEVNGKMWSHMIADTPEELESMRKRLGLKREWLHASRVKGIDCPHYDLVTSKYNLAIRYGAIEITSHQMLDKLMGRDES